MTDAEFSRVLKRGLGEPAYSTALANRVVRGVRDADGDSTTPKRQSCDRRWTAARRFVLVAAALGAMVLLNAPAVYLAPAYGAALANAPGIGSVSQAILSGVGVTPSEIAPANDVSTSSGHTLRLVGAYADGSQTVFLVQIDNQSLADASGARKADAYLVVGAATLTDQFGHSYVRQSAPSGDQRPVVFAPLDGPVSIAGGRLTLHVQRLSDVGAVPLQTVEGNWTLHATLLQHLARELPAPPPAVLGGNTYTITAVRASSLLEIQWQVSGPVVAAAASDPSRNPSDDVLTPQVVGPATPMQSGWEIDRDNVARGQITVALAAPGTYDIRFGANSIGFADRQITVR